MSTGNEPTLAQATVDGSCHECGAPLAADQRYCLNCGTRRAAPRVPIGLQAATPVAALPPVPAEPSLAARVGGGWGVAALVLLALGVGVVIGTLGGDEPAPAAARPPVVTIAAGALAPTGATAVAAPVAPAPVAVTGPTGTSGTTGTTGTTDTSAPAAETKEKLAAKEKLTPEQFQDQSKKLPKTTGTGGAAPEKDDAAPGAGSEAESIG